jgi:D-alanyl-D-alanine carboxypeptidase/D-alanyl-D-alanine-endopeptidase (penicillin-binding protein 4)
LDEVRGAIRDSGLKEASIAVSVRDADSDEELVAIEADRPMIPASNMKLLTSGAALHLLGTDFRFRTRLLALREHEASGAEVTLVVAADGDPGFADPVLLAQTSWTDQTGRPRRGMKSDELLGVWVDAVKAAGITSVREVVVDDRVFAREFYHPAWPISQLNERSFAEVAGLNFQTNLLGILPRPGQGPRPDFTVMRPNAPWIVIENKATASTGKKDKQDVWFSRAPKANTFTARGNVKFASADPIDVPLHDAPSFFAKLLAHRLTEAGIKTRSARVASAEDPRFVAEDGSVLLGTPVGPVVETPIQAVLDRCNTNSQNVHAEALLKRSGRAATGRPGSWASGAVAIFHVLTERLGEGALIEGAKISDGSGLSRENRLTARMLTAWLNSFHTDSRLSAAFIDSLAVGGESGTLRSRFAKLSTAGVAVQCKTGFINGVSCLSGYVTTPDGRRRSFSVLGNNLTQAGAVAKAKKLQETIVELVAADMSTVAIGGN